MHDKNSPSSGICCPDPHFQTVVQENDSVAENFKNYLISYPLLLLCIWGFFYVFWDDAALPGGTVWTIICLSTGAFLLGQVVGLTGLPPQLGMLIAGIILGNVPYTFVNEDLYQLIFLQLRWIAIVVSVTKGALGIFPKIIWEHKTIICPLAVFPYLFEGVTWYLGCHYFAGHSSSASFFVATLFSAMSGILLGPYLTNLEQELATLPPNTLSPHGNVLPSLCKSTMGLDAVWGILLCKSAIGFMYSDDFQSGLLKGPGEVGLGAGLGILWGCLAGFLLSNERHSTLRVLVTLVGGTVAFIGLRKLGYPRGTHVGVLVGAFTAMTIWREKKAKILGLEKILATNDSIWEVVQPFLFAIIGARINIWVIDWNMLALGWGVWVATATVRLTTAYFCTGLSKLTRNERIFILTAWVGKGTLQAAIGPVPMETALLQGKPQDWIDDMQRIIELAVITLISSNCIGYIGVKLFGKKLLTVADNQQNTEFV